ncbi:MAG TPA: RbsD/FucU family protein [Chthonomonadaceae bacterium]|nr:RbsD/FucU family protein [Chthonomonadaceae bacterium]
MLKNALLHPEILNALAGAGHGSQVLIADGNYPCSTTAGPNADLVYLNLAPGLVNATDTLRALVTAIPIEAAHVMQTADGSEPPIFQEFRQLLPPGVAIQPVERFAFYAAVGEPSVCLVIATGEQRIYANILLTIGVVPPSH